MLAFLDSLFSWVSRIPFALPFTIVGAGIALSRRESFDPGMRLLVGLSLAYACFAIGYCLIRSGETEDRNSRIIWVIVLQSLAVTYWFPEYRVLVLLCLFPVNAALILSVK